MRRWVCALAISIGFAPAHASPAPIPNKELSCAVTASTLAFGRFDPLGGALPGTGTISGTCSGALGHSEGGFVTLGNGDRLQPNGNRAMGCTTCTGRFASDLLQYQLYTDASHSTVWIGNASVQVFGHPAEHEWRATVYGTIFAAVPGGMNDVAAGGYADSVLVTINF